MPKPKTETNVFLSLKELAVRWRRSPITVERLAHKLGIPLYRLTTKQHLYALSDIEAVEAGAKGKKPVHVHSIFKCREEEATK